MRMRMMSAGSGLAAAGLIVGLAGMARAQDDVSRLCLPALPSVEVDATVPAGKFHALRYNPIIAGEYRALRDELEIAAGGPTEEIKDRGAAQIAELEALAEGMGRFELQQALFVVPPPPYRDRSRDCLLGPAAPADGEALLLHASDALRVQGDMCAEVPQVVHVGADSYLLQDVYSDELLRADGYPYLGLTVYGGGFVRLLRAVIGIRLHQCGSLPARMQLRFLSTPPRSSLDQSPPVFETLLQADLAFAEDRFFLSISEDDLARAAIGRLEATQEALARQSSVDAGGVSFALGVLFVAGAMAVLGSDLCRAADIPGAEPPAHCDD